MNNEHYLRSVKGLSFAIAFIISGPAMSAEKFSVANEQIQALGIKTSAVQSMKQTVSTRYPGQVVVPPKAEQIVSSPLEGVVVQLLVGEYQAVRKGEPVVRLSSPAMSQLQLQLLQASARATLAQTYFQLRAAERQQALLDASVAAYGRALELTRNRYAAGVAGKADVAQAESQLRSARAAALDASLSRSQYEHAIAVLLGLAGHDPETVDVDAVPALPPHLADLFQRDERCTVLANDLQTVQQFVAAHGNRGKPL